MQLSYLLSFSALFLSDGEICAETSAEREAERQLCHSRQAESNKEASRGLAPIFSSSLLLLVFLHGTFTRDTISFVSCLVFL